jgi:lipopolysaccharide export system protein LptA
MLPGDKYVRQKGQILRGVKVKVKKTKKEAK